MRESLRAFLILILLLFVSAPAFGQEPPAPSHVQRRYNEQIDVPARNIVIELEPTEEAEKFLVQVEPIGKVWAHPYIFDVDAKDPKLRIRLSPGKYKVRTKSIDAEGFYGPWSGWLPFDINYKPPTEVFPNAGASIQPKSGINERIAFEWPEVEGAAGYRFQLKKATGEVIKDFKTKNTWTFEELDLGTEYSWTFKPLDAKEWKEKNDVPLPEDYGRYDFRVQGPQAGTRDVNITATAAPHATKYQFEFLKLDTEGERGSASIYESKTNEFPLTLAPGAYEIRVRTYYDDKSVSDWSPPWAFLVPYEPVELIAPADGKAIDPRDDEASPVRFRWKAQKDVHHYVVYTYDENGKFFKDFTTKESEIVAGLPHDRKYRWFVVPYPSAQRANRAPEIPENAPSFSIGHYIPLKLAAAEEPSYLYTWGRYYTSMIDYTGKNYDNNSLVHQPIYGGTGEVAFGYWHRKTHFGLLTHVSYSGFLLGGNIYNYGSAGLHLGYRQIFKGGSRLRVWLGANYMEFPEFLRDPFVKNMDYRLVKNYGPQIQVSYMGDIPNMPKYGWHVFATAYQGSGDISTPNGAAQVPRLSYTLGAFGTYLYSPTTKWMAGYAYKVEAVQYKSYDRTGLDNQSVTSGHFLSLSIEYGFGEPYK